MTAKVLKWREKVIKGKETTYKTISFAKKGKEGKKDVGKTNGMDNEMENTCSGFTE